MTTTLRDRLTGEIIGAAIEVHRYWGPGLYEDIYEKSLCHELHLRQISYVQQLAMPVLYKGVAVSNDLKLDLLVEGKVVVELKTVKQLDVAHEAQLLTYMRLAECRVGLLINFNALRLKDGIKRMVL